MYNDHFIDKALRNKHMKSVLAEIIAQKPRFQSMPIKKNWYELDAFQIFFYLWSAPLLYLKVQLAGFLALILIDNSRSVVFSSVELTEDFSTDRVPLLSLSGFLWCRQIVYIIIILR